MFDSPPVSGVESSRYDWNPVSRLQSFCSQIPAAHSSPLRDFSFMSTNHNRAIASGDRPAFSAHDNRLDALRKIAASDPDEGKRSWARRKIAELTANK